MSATTDDLLLSEGPNGASVEYQARNALPILIPLPWTEKKTLLGDALDSQSILKGSLECTRLSPFDSTRLQNTAYYLQVGRSVKQRSGYSSHSSALQEHMQFNGSLSIGNSFLGVTGKLEYINHMKDNRDTSLTSEQMTLRVGYLTFQDLPALSQPAITLLKEIGVDAFKRKYGDYYVAGMHIGLDNVSCLSSSADIDFRRELKEIAVQGKAFGASMELYKKHEEEEKGGQKFRVSASGFDTLTNGHFRYNAFDAQAYLDATKHIHQNIQNARTAVSRVDEQLKALGINPDQAITQQVTATQVQQILGASLVVELQLMPYSLLSDYSFASLSGQTTEQASSPNL